MWNFKDLPIRRKLLLCIMSISLFTLILAIMGFMAYDFSMLRKESARELRTMAEVIGYNCIASLVFDDPADARDTLETLKGHKSIEAAWVFTKIGEIHAEYIRNDIRRPFMPPKLEIAEAFFEPGHLLCSWPIFFEGQLIGSVCLQSDLGELRSIIRKHFGIALLVLLVCLLAALLLSSRLGRSTSTLL